MDAALTLDPGESETYNPTYVVSASDIVSDSVINNAWVEGYNTNDEYAYSFVQKRSTIIAANPGIDIEKSTNGDDADSPTGPILSVGETVTWEYVVENTGNVVLTGVVVNDDMLGPICTIGTMNPGATATCTAIGSAVIGQYANIGDVVGYYDGSQVTDDDPSHYLVRAGPSIHIEKSTNGDDADSPTGPILSVDDTVTWEYVVENTGNVVLTGVVVNDDMLGPLCTIGTMNPGDIDSCTATGSAVVGQYANIGDVVGYYDGSPVTDDDPSHYYGLQECGVCLGKVTQLTLEYTGSMTGALIQIYQKDPPKSQLEIFYGIIDPGEMFTFYGVDKHGTMGPEITIFVNGVYHTTIHTSCSMPIGPGLVSGDFLVIEGYSKDGGLLCPI